MKNEFAIFINITLLLSSLTMAIFHQVDKYQVAKPQPIKPQNWISSTLPTNEPTPFVNITQSVDAATLAADAATSAQYTQPKIQIPTPTAKYKQAFPASKQAELHAVGVYEADNPDKVVWWKKCGDLTPAQCHTTYASQRDEGSVEVNVSYSKKPIILVLMAYEPTHWIINQSGDSKIEAVILGGYHSQRVSGISSSIPIQSYTYENSACGECSKGDGYFHSYELKDSKALDKLYEITGRRVSSFQGSYKGKTFNINDLTPKLNYEP